MKNNKGVTLTSVIIYIIGLAIIIGIIANLTSFFYKNIDVSEINNDTITQYTKFSSIFITEINKENNYVIDCKTIDTNEQKTSYIIFSTGNQYTFKNNSIYKNKIKICENIDFCDFSYIFEDSIYKIKVDFKTKSIDMTGDNAIIYNLKTI